MNIPIEALIKQNISNKNIKYYNSEIIDVYCNAKFEKFEKFKNNGTFRSFVEVS